MALLVAPFWRAAELAKLPALHGARLCLSWTAQGSQLGLRLLGAPAAQASAAVLPAKDVSQLQAAPPSSEGQLRQRAREGLSALRSAACLCARLALALLFACLVYALPVWGTTLKVPLHLLPGEGGADAIAEVEVLQWAASLSPGFVLVDAELELTVPNSPFNARSFERAEGAVRVDLEFAGFRASRALVPPQISEPARRARELLLALPMALGLLYDEQTLRLPLVTGLPPQELIRAASSANTAATLAADGPAGTAFLRVTPTIAARSAQLTFGLRPGGPLGKLLSSFAGFVPICALVLYYGLLSGRRLLQGIAVCDGYAGPGVAPLSFVEVQMLTKGLANAGGAVPAHFAETFAAFQAEDRRLHGGSLRGLVALRRLPAVAEAAAHEWRSGFDEGEMRRIVAATLELPPAPGGMVTPDGMLRYGEWLAIATVAMLCGGRELADYAEWVARNQRKRA